MIEPFTPHIGKDCVIRTYASGVHFGRLVAQDGRMVEIADSLRLWRWRAKDGIALSGVAVHGIVARDCKIDSLVPSMTILDALEIIPATEGAAASIRAAVK